MTEDLVFSPRPFQDEPFHNLRGSDDWIEFTLLRSLHRFVSPRLTVFSVWVNMDRQPGRGYP